MSRDRPPRVLQVVISLRPGGTERLVVELVKRAGLPTAVCCLDERGLWGDELLRQGILVESLDRQAGFHPLLGRQVANVAARHGATVIHCHQYSPFVYSALARPWRPSLRVVFTEHGRLSDAPPSPKRRAVNRFLRYGATRVFAVSAELREHIVAEGFSERQTGVIYNGIDVLPAPSPAQRDAVRGQLQLPDSAVVVATVARLDPVKDLGVLVQAVSQVNAETPMRLLVVGDGSERAALEKAAQAADGGRSTIFLGHREDARALLAGCDLFANSSISEGVSLTILEAMAAGLPVVATRVGGTPEVVDDTCARLVPARNVEAMTDALRALARDPQLCAALGRAGRRRVEERFTLERMVREYREEYVRPSPPKL